MIAFCACDINKEVGSSSLVTFKTLDRGTIIDELIKLGKNQVLYPDGQINEIAELQDSGELSTSVILDDSGSMGWFLHDACNDQYGNNIYKNILKTLDNILPSANCFKLSDGGGSEPIISRFFLTNAIDINFYRRSDNNNITPLSKYLDSFLDMNYDISNNHLFLLVSDLCFSGDTDENGFPERFIELLSKFINSKIDTIGVIGIKAKYLGAISDMPDLVLDKNGDILSISDKKNRIHSNYVNQGKVTERPIYLLFMGNANAVKKYMEKVRETLPDAETLSNAGEYSEFIFDEYPNNFTNSPSIEEFSLLKPVLNEELLKYTMETEGLLYMVSDSLVGSEGQTNENIKWDDFISEQGIPFWRIYTEWNSSERQNNDRPGLTIDIENFFNNLPFTERLSIKVLDSNKRWLTEETDTNAYIYISKNEDELNKIHFKLVANNFKYDEPLLFVVDIERKVKNTYEPYQFKRSNDFKWLENWTLDLRVFRDETYIMNSDGEYLFSMSTKPEKANNSYTQADKTPFLKNLFGELLNMRTEFIKSTMDNEQIAYTAHKYAVFGFVVRREYNQYGLSQNSKTDTNESGGFAFSIDEVKEINNK